MKARASSRLKKPLQAKIKPKKTQATTQEQSTSKATSRIKKKKLFKKIQPQIKQVRGHLHHYRYSLSAIFQKIDRSDLINLCKNYIKHFPTLIISLPFFWAVVYIYTNVYPLRIKNILFASSYLPFLLCFFLANFFFFAFLSLNTKKGLLISLLLSFILFLKLQLFQITFVMKIILSLSILIVLLIKFPSKNKEKN